MTRRLFMHCVGSLPSVRRLEEPGSERWPERALLLASPGDAVCVPAPVDPDYLDFLAGNQEYHCTPWGNPTRNIFGWQRPCYLLGEGYVGSFKELMETTEWDRYGTGNYEKCADCMAHCGYEATAVSDAFARAFSPRRLRSRWSCSSLRVC